MASKKVIREMFMEYDTDESGAIDIAELKKGLEGLSEEAQDESLVALQKADKDGDGKITWKEFKRHFGVRPGDSSSEEEEQEQEQEQEQEKEEKPADGNGPTDTSATDSAELEALRAAFKNYDEDKSGTIELADIKKFLSFLTEEAQINCWKNLAKADEDKDGKITWDEFKKHFYDSTSEKKEEQETEGKAADSMGNNQTGTSAIDSAEIMKLRAKFQKYDKDNSGTIELADVKKVLSFLPEDGQIAAWKLLEVADKNKDGRITWDEFKGHFCSSWENKEEQEKKGNSQTETSAANNAELEELRVMFKNFDQENTGAIQLADVKKVLSALPEDKQMKTWKNLAVADENKDEKITWEEFKKCFYDEKYKKKDEQEKEGKAADGASSSEKKEEQEKEEKAADGNSPTEASAADSDDLEKLRAAFKGYDKDNSGTIELADVKKALSFMSEDGQQMAWKRLTAADKNKDEKITWDEFKAHFGDLSSEKKEEKEKEEKTADGNSQTDSDELEKLRAAFRGYDKDNSGTIELADVKKALSFMSEDGQQMAWKRLTAADKDKDDKITWDEFKAYFGDSSSEKKEEQEKEEKTAESKGNSQTETSAANSAELEKLRARFTKYDKDNSGTIELADVKKVLSFLPEDGQIDAWKLLAVADENKDGKITWDEFKGYFLTSQKAK